MSDSNESEKKLQTVADTSTGSQSDVDAHNEQDVKDYLSMRKSKPKLARMLWEAKDFD